MHITSAFTVRAETGLRYNYIADKFVSRKFDQTLQDYIQQLVPRRNMSVIGIM